MKLPVLKTKSRVLRTGYSYIYSPYIYAYLYMLIFYICLPADGLQPISLLSFQQVGS